jgi:hypothetical protein
MIATRNIAELVSGLSTACDSGLSARLSSMVTLPILQRHPVALSGGHIDKQPGRSGGLREALVVGDERSKPSAKVQGRRQVDCLRTAHCRGSDGLGEYPDITTEINEVDDVEHGMGVPGRIVRPGGFGSEGGGDGEAFQDGFLHGAGGQAVADLVDLRAGAGQASMGQLVGEAGDREVALGQD